MLMHLRLASSRHCSSPGPNRKDTREWCEYHWPHGDMCTHHSWIQPAIDKNDQAFTMDQHGILHSYQIMQCENHARTAIPGLCKIDSVASTNKHFDSKHFRMDCLCSEPSKNCHLANQYANWVALFSVEECLRSFIVLDNAGHLPGYHLEPFWEAEQGTIQSPSIASSQI